MGTFCDFFGGIVVLDIALVVVCVSDIPVVDGCVLEIPVVGARGSDIPAVRACVVAMPAVVACEMVTGIDVVGVTVIKRRKCIMMTTPVLITMPETK